MIKLELTEKETLDIVTALANTLRISDSSIYSQRLYRLANKIKKQYEAQKENKK